jgi:hypothetical protein
LDQEEEKIKKELLVKEFEQYWLTRSDCDWEKRSLLDREFCKKFSNNEIYLNHFNEPLERILNALYSVKFRQKVNQYKDGIKRTSKKGQLIISIASVEWVERQQ